MQAIDSLPVSGSAVSAGRNSRSTVASRLPKRHDARILRECLPTDIHRPSIPACLLQGMFLLGFSLSAPAMANEAAGVLQISLRVVASCTVQTQPLVFATYTTGGAATGTATPGVIEVSCPQDTPAAVYLDGDRTLAGPGGARVVYTLQANGQAWPVGKPIAVQGQGGRPVRLELSGSVPAGQKVAPGDYAQAAVVRVVY